MIDEAKKAANQLKEQGKNAAAKAGGAAISAASGGVIPPKLGEWASKKALNKAEKKIKELFELLKQKETLISQKEKQIEINSLNNVDNNVIKANGVSILEFYFKKYIQNQRRVS